ncbi:MAG: SDR family NAD(P)-dependent oxidoreductase [Cyclobacteriaceae bacterium]
MQQSLQNISEFDIAIIGMAGRFPGADSIESYWENLANGVESISFFSEEELIKAGVDAAFVNDPSYVKASPVLENYKSFDAKFFGYSPREAVLMDPQQRIFLECAWHAMEHAGYNPEDFNGPIGVYGGTAMNTYFINSGHNSKFVTDYLSTLIGNDNNFLTTRVSYKLNLKGPSVTVQTACSTSLVAVHSACQSLINEECDLALAGGVSIRVPNELGHFYSKGAVFSPDGHCRPFDASAQGTIFGSGVGIVTLKRLIDAVKDNDTIHAVIKGSAVNNDGSRKTDYTAPSVNSQAEVVVEALASAGVSADSISYIEAHGTGTYLGDPIEVTALTKAFRMDTDKNQYCAIGSVKSNIGHLDAAAGVAGLIKTALALKHQKIPATLNFETPNPEIDFPQSPFFINDRLREWTTNGPPRRAGVTSLGIGGTNAHIVLEEAPSRKSAEQSPKPRLMVWSSHSATALGHLTENLSAYLASTDFSFQDITSTLQVGRKALKHRRFLVSEDRKQASELLQNPDPSKVPQGLAPDQSKDLVFMFPGGGAQYPNMGKDLYQGEVKYREEVDLCLDFLSKEMDFDLKPLLFPEESALAEAREAFKRPSIGLPALFISSYAMARLWDSWGIKPSAMTGHSVGEYVAACLSGVISWQDALYMVVIRGRLFETLPKGSMLSIPMSEKEVTKYLKDDLTLAAINTPSLCVASGPEKSIDQLFEVLAKEGVEAKKLKVDVAAHSPMIDVILEDFDKALQKIKLKPPEIPYISNVTGSWITKEMATSNQYYQDHLRSAVRFNDTLEELLKVPGRIFLEVGPGRNLSTFVNQHPLRSKEQTAYPSMRHPKEEGSDLIFQLNALGKLFLEGIKINWEEVNGKQPLNRVPLPVYPFDRSEHWYSAKQNQLTARSRQELKNWGYVPTWKKRANLNLGTLELPTGAWVIMGANTELESALEDSLQSQGKSVHRFTSSLNKKNNSDIEIDSTDKEEFERLMTIVKESDINILYCCLFEGNTDQYLANFMALSDTASVCGHMVDKKFRIGVISKDTFEITGEEKIVTGGALLIGPTRVIPKEYPHIKMMQLDMQLIDHQSLQLSPKILNEFSRSSVEPIRVLKERSTWSMHFEPVTMSPGIPSASKFKKQGVYAITGGLNGVGLEVAKHLANEYQVKLALLGRSKIPSKDSWDKLLADSSLDRRTKERIEGLKFLEEKGIEVLTPIVDVGDKEAVAKTFNQLKQHFGSIDGVIHSAGMIDDSPISQKTRETLQNVLSPKVEGTNNLKDQVAALNIPLFIQFSSINAYLAPTGQIDYVSASAFLDANSQPSATIPDCTTININWPGWKEVGILTDLPEGPWKEKAMENAITNREGLEVFERIVSSGLHHIVIYPRDFQSAYGSSLTFTGLDAPEEEIEVQEEMSFDSSIEGPRNQLEEEISKIWRSRLGIKQLGIYENYYELGGNSLLGTQIIADINKSTNVSIDIKDLFAAPTVASLASLVDEKQVTQQDNSNKLADLLKKVQSPGES